MKLLLISGKAESGKDTVANIMAERFADDGKSMLVTHYADLLKFICSNYLGWDGVKDDKGRRLLQYVGTDVFRAKEPDIWVNFVLKILGEFKLKWDYVIIPDCRFKNEQEVPIAQGFDTTLIRIDREGYINHLSDGNKTHASETALDDMNPDYVIKNKGSLEDLKYTVNKFIEEIIYAN